MADRETREALAQALVCQRRLAAAIDVCDLTDARELAQELAALLMVCEDKIGVCTPTALFDMRG